MFKSKDSEGGEAKRAQAVLAGRLQCEERLSSQSHLRPVRISI